MRGVAWIRRIGLWASIGLLVVLVARGLVYALVPQPTLLSLQLGQSAGGPRLVILTLVVLGLCTGVAAAVVWLAAAAVQEQHALAGVSYPRPRLRLGSLLRQTFLLWTATSLAFALVESYNHWRAGLGFHGLTCLLGPVHRDALPVLAGLSLLAAAVVTAVRHAVGWLRRVMPLLLAAIRAPAGNGPSLTPVVRGALSRRTPGAVQPRGPPAFSS